MESAFALCSDIKKKWFYNHLLLLLSKLQPLAAESCHTVLRVQVRTEFEWSVQSVKYIKFVEFELVAVCRYLGASWNYPNDPYPLDDLEYWPYGVGHLIPVSTHFVSFYNYYDSKLISIIKFSRHIWTLIKAIVWLLILWGISFCLNLNTN